MATPLNADPITAKCNDTSTFDDDPMFRAVLVKLQ